MDRQGVVLIYQYVLVDFFSIFEKVLLWGGFRYEWGNIVILVLVNIAQVV